MGRRLVGEGRATTTVERKQDGRETFLGTADSSSIGQQHRMVLFCTLKRVRGSCKPAVFCVYGHRVLVDASLEVCFWVGDLCGPLRWDVAGSGAYESTAIL